MASEKGQVPDPEPRLQRSVHATQQLAVGAVASATPGGRDFRSARIAGHFSGRGAISRFANKDLPQIMG